MLIKITNKCEMGCSHCLEDSTVKGEHMTWDVFLRAIELTKRMERMAWQSGIPALLHLSGGECTEHPEIIRFMEEAYRQGFFLTLISNGSWLDNAELRAAILRPEWPHLQVQITNDSRFYPRPVPKVDDKRLIYVEALTHLITLGRAARKKNIDRKGVPMKNAPTSFNFRSLTRSYNSVEKALVMMRARALMGKGGHCSPSICADGRIVAGESQFCFAVGTVDSTNDEITKATCDMQCNACGLVDNLTQEQKRAIGEASLFLGTEE